MDKLRYVNKETVEAVVKRVEARLSLASPATIVLKNEIEVTAYIAHDKFYLIDDKGFLLEFSDRLDFGVAIMRIAGLC